MKYRDRVSELGTRGGTCPSAERQRPPRSLRGRLALVAFAAVGFAILLPSAAFANAQGAHYVLASECPVGFCSLRMTRADLTRSGTAWSVPSSVAGYEWVAVENSTSTACSTNGWGGCIVQTGYGKFDTTAANSLNCPSSTGGDVKVVDYWIDGNGNRTCTVGSIISSGGDHTLKVARCNSSDWCIYKDGTLEHDWSSTGIGVTAPQADTAGEFTCNSCMTSSTYISTNFGTSGSGYAWQVGDGTNSANVTQEYAHTTNYAPCGIGSASFWEIDNVNPNSPWTIAWQPNGTNC